MDSTALQHILARIRRRLMWIVGTASFVWGLVGAAAIAVAGMWCDLLVDLPPVLRAIVLVGAAVGAAVVFAFGLRRAIRQAAPHWLADRLDSVADSRGQIRAGVDLDRQRDAASRYSADPSLTTGLAALAVDRATQLASGVSPASAVPARPLRRPGIAVLAALVGVLLVGLFFPRLALTQWLRFSDPFGDHPPFSPYVFHIEPAGARVVFGGDLDIRIRVDGPAADQLELVLEPLTGTSANGTTDVLPMFAEPGGEWRVTVMNVTEAQRYFARIGRSRSPRYPLTVITVPRIEEVRFRVMPPAYTGERPTEGPLPDRNIGGLKGTRVAVRARSNRPLLSGEIRLPAGPGKVERLALRPDSSGAVEVAGEFTLAHPGRFELRLTDTSHQESTESYSGSITLVSDESPFVRLLQPREVSLATPTAILPVLIAAEDDFGLAKCELYRSLNDSRASPLDVPLRTPPPRRTQEHTLLPLAAYGLEPGDEIKLFARVQDNDPETNDGKGAESPVAVIRIISQEEFDRLQRREAGLDMLMSKYQQAQRRMESLAEEMHKLQEELARHPADAPLPEELLRKLKQLADRMEQEAELLRKAGQEKLPYELDKELSPHLDAMAEQLERLTKRARDAAPGLKSKEDMQKLLKELEQQLAKKREQLASQTQLPLELLKQIMPLKQAESRFVEIYQRQKDLAERLASLKGQDGLDDPALKTRMRELQDEQQQVREDLDQLLSDIEEHVAQLPDDDRLQPLRDSALEFVEAVRDSEASEAMTDAEAGLAEFSGTKGAEHARRAEEILKEFLKQCSGMGRACESCLPKFAPSLGSCLNQTIDQLLADMGFNPGDGTGDGPGVGAGQGYSARRNTMNNVGLYGGQPTLDAGGQSQDGNRADLRPASTRSAGRGSNQPGDGEESHPARARPATGAADAVIPPRYRSKVSRYFQRLADEVGQ